MNFTTTSFECKMAMHCETQLHFLFVILFLLLLMINTVVFLLLWTLI